VSPLTSHPIEEAFTINIKANGSNETIEANGEANQPNKT
jgi:hypothetical protein